MLCRLIKRRNLVVPARVSPLTSSEDCIMIYTLISLLVLFWLVGLFAHIGGSFIHGLLVLALVIFVINLLTGRSTV